MVIENKLESAKARMGYVILIFLAIILLIWAFLKDIPNNNYQTLYLAIALFCGYIYIKIIDVNYFYLNDSRDKLIIRYFNVHPMLQKYKMFEIAKSIIIDYRIEKKLFGLKSFLIITVKTKQGTVDYPAVNVSGLNKKNKTELQTALDKLKKQK